MEEIRQWFPIIVTVISNVVAITLSYAKLSSKIEVSDVRTAGQFKASEDLATEKFKNIEGKIDTINTVLENQIGEIKENHLKHLDEKIDCISKDLTKHLIDCK